MKPKKYLDAKCESVVREHAQSVEAAWAAIQGGDFAVFQGGDWARAMQSMDDPGWSQILRILNAASKDDRILSSPSASSFLDAVIKLAKIATLDEEPETDGIKAFRPLAADLAGEQLGRYNGRENGGETMKKIKEAHIEHLTQPVIDLLKHPKTSDWSDTEIASWLMEPRQAFHVFNGKEVKQKTMTLRVKEIRATYKASI